MPNEISNATLGRLRYSKGFELNEAIASILESGVPKGSIKTIVDAVKKRLAEQEYITNENVTGLLGLSSDAELYAQTKEQISSDTWSLLKVFGLGIDDTEIEELLAGMLAQCADKDTDPRRSYIAEALGKFGTPEVLPLLEMLYEDLKPSATVRSLFLQHLDLVEAFEAKARIAFVVLLARTIDTIKKRSNPGVRNDGAGPTDEPNVARKKPPYFEYARKASSLLSQNPEASVMFVRKATESVAKEVCQTLGVGGEKVQKLTLGPLVKELGKIEEVAHIHRLLDTLVPLSNYASHDQGGMQSEIVDEALAGHLLGILESAINHTDVWLGARQTSR